MNRFLSASLLAAFSFLVSCNDDSEPDYPIEPYIESADLKYIEVGSVVDPDSLILSFYFRDGDMDLGLDPSTVSDSDYPYHPFNYFLENNGKFSVISTVHIGANPFLVVPVDQHGKLVTIRTRQKAGYGFLPEFNCSDYTKRDVYVLKANKEIFDETFTLHENVSNPEGYHLLDTFYYEMNENHYNVLVDYLVKQPDGSFIEFDWHKEFCIFGFNGRFPLLGGLRKGIVVDSGPFKIKGHSSKDGEFRYSMSSTGFKTLFEEKTIKLRIRIKDRALHDSNVIETNEIQI